MGITVDDFWSLIWKIIDNDVKLEVTSYLILQAQNERKNWNLRPHTRDGSRDIEQTNARGTYYCEAKYRGKTKLSLEDVGRDISNAILSKINKLWITTNSDIRQNLFSYVEKFNNTSDVTIKKLSIELIDGTRLQHLITVENSDELHTYLNQIIVTGYCGNDASMRSLAARESYQQTGREIVEKLTSLKNVNSHLFVCNPTLENLILHEGLINISDFFITSFEFIYNKEYSDWPSNRVKIMVGSEFICQIVVKNLFADLINYSIEIDSNVGIQILQPHKHDQRGILSVEKTINPHAVTTVDVICKVNNIPKYFNLHIKANKLNYIRTFSLDSSFFDNRLLHTPFFTTNENRIIQEVQERIYRTFNSSGIGITVFKGRGGVGKSVMIEEICNAIRKQKYESIYILHFQGPDMINISKTIIIDFLKIEQLIRESDYAQIVKTMLLDDDNKELRSIIDLLFSNDFDGIFNADQTKLLSILISLVLDKISAVKNILLIIEDIHLANKSSLDFISIIINNQYIKRTNTSIILAERVDLYPDKNPYLETFYNSIDSEIIKDYWLYDFTKQDAIHLVDSYTDFDLSDRDWCLNRIIGIAGTNPLNIINFLLSVKSSSHAYFTAEGLLHIHRHDLASISYTTETIIKERFNNATKLSKQYLYLFFFMVLFKNRLPKHVLSLLFTHPVSNALSYLQEYRFIFVGTLSLRFDHETLYNFFKNNVTIYLTPEQVEICAVNAYHNAGICSKEVLINILFYCPQEYEDQFNDICLNHINDLIDVEDKKAAISYCDFFLSKHENKTDVESILSCASVKETKYNIEKEYENIDNVINQSLELEKELDNYYVSKNYEKKLNDIKCRLYGNLGSAYQQTSDARKSIEYLNKLLNHLDKQDKSLCQIYNRLGVSYKIAGNINKAISSITKSLRLAYRQENQYMIYHNYYDASECFMALGNIGAARKYMNIAANIDYTQFGNRQQVGYIDSRNMLLYHQMLFDNINNIKELDALAEKAYQGNFTWHYCNIANLRGIAELKEGRFKSAAKYFKELLSYCETYSKSSKQKIYILNNIIASLYFQNQQGEATPYVDDLIKIIQNEISKIRPYEGARSRVMMSIMNLQKIDPEIDEKLTMHFKPELTLIEQEYCIFHYADMSFYLIYH